VSDLLIGLLCGAIGMAYIAYGKRQTKFAPLLSGIALCAYPYFVDGWLWLIGIGAVLMVLPFVFDF
jgi:hypothetical protein